MGPTPGPEETRCALVGRLLAVRLLLLFVVTLLEEAGVTVVVSL